MEYMKTAVGLKWCLLLAISKILICPALTCADSNPLLAYSSCIGGGVQDEAFSVVVDTNGATCIVGFTISQNYPVTNAYQSKIKGDADGFISKFSPVATNLLFSTYFGGSQDDRIYDVATDSSGAIYVCGVTTSLTNFPITNAVQPVHGGGTADGFAAKFSPDGSNLMYSTYLGGRDIDIAIGIYVDDQGAAYVAGVTHSTNFPVVHAFQPVYGGGDDIMGEGDAFLVKLSPAGSNFVYSTYLGGTNYDEAYDVAVDSNHCPYVGGMTLSPDFPVTNAFQKTIAGYSAVFVSKFNAAGAGLVYSTFLDGCSNDFARAIALDAEGCAYICGHTQSTNFPLQSPLQANFAWSTNEWPRDVFITKLLPQGTGLVYSTYLGAPGQESPNDIVVDASGAAVVVGVTSSTNFPLMRPFQSQFGGPGPYAESDAFISRLSPDGTRLEYSTYLGGSSDDTAKGVAVDQFGTVYVAGETMSSNSFPSVHAIKTNYFGSSFDGFLSKISLTSLSSIEMQGPDVALTWDSCPGVRYSLQSAEGPLTNWSILVPPGMIPGCYGTMTVTGQTESSAARFYRISAQ